MEKKNKTEGFNIKYLIIFLVGVFLLSGTVSYAYFTAQTKSEGAGEVTTEITTIKEDNRLVTEGELTFDDKDIYPGHKSISSIKVTAYGDIEINYNVIWTGTSSFTTPLKYSVYKTTTEETPSITCNKKTGLVDNVTIYYEECTNNDFDNLGDIVAEGEIPTLTESTKVELIKNESIQATSEGNTVYYYVVIEFPNKEGGQNADFNASINGEVSTEIAKPTASEVILANKTISTRSSFNTAVTASSTGTMYSAEDDDGPTYYFAGAATDNYVYFAGYYWRIIRVNGDGTIRLIYDGTSARENGTSSSDTQTGTSAFNSNYNDNAYVGFKYGTAGSSTYAATHANTNNSTIKGVLDTWYTNNLKSYDSYIDVNAGFCGDRTPSTSKTTSNGLGGTGTTVTYYGAYIRLYNSGTPTFKCSNGSDLYTVGTSSKGNKSLTNPIGLINLNEIWYGGGCQATNRSYYLYTGQTYFTMSPHSFNDIGALMFAVQSSGNLNDYYVYATYGVRPVINLRSDVTFIGSGLVNDPYKVS